MEQLIFYKDKFVNTDFLRKNADVIFWWEVQVNYLPLDFLREFKDKIDWSTLKTSNMSFYDILRYNNYIDIDFIREFINGYEEDRRFELRQVISILDSRGFSPKQCREFLRMWVDWHVEVGIKGYY